MIKKAATQLRGYAVWVRQLSQDTRLLFAARTVVGRSMKIFLFGVGTVLPLGSLIWVLLFLHGSRNSGSRPQGGAMPAPSAAA